MILLLDTSSPNCYMTLVDGDGNLLEYNWLAEKKLAKGLLVFINEKLGEVGKDWRQITALGVFEGPGSFTGLRIGLTVMNTLANALRVPIVGGRGVDWKNDAINMIRDGIDQKVVTPFYGSEANITKAIK